ncbi:HAMP domain-containing protein [Ideonella sp. 4Y11]|uniref:HAMP domain-containing protein n=1 Tax=Ideonella aquatica TaxID=2824119 RepID=A0A941BIB2_9BURK|nr:methyl-accepting chemotaxis protein [Ideonella aquatica]MBQ0957658.1 HAMP domain-containing protein [Ideonella aquatica]
MSFAADGSLLRPAVSVMRQLRLPAKMALIVALIAVPLLILIARTLLDTGRELAVARNEAQGARVVTALLDVAVLTQKHRGQTNLAMSGNASAESALQATRADLTKALAAMQGEQTTLQAWGLAEAWPPIATSLAALAQGRREGDRAQVFAAHTAQIKAVRTLVSQVGEVSELYFDPEAASYFLMDVVVERTLPLTEVAGLLRGQGAGLISRGEAALSDMAQVNGRVAMLQEQTEGMKNRVAALVRAGEPEPAGFAPMVETNQAFAALAGRSFAEGQPQGDAQAFFKAGTTAIEATIAFSRQATSRLSEILRAREQRLQQRQWLALGGSLLGILVLAYALVGFYSSVMDALQRVSRVAHAGAEGDLSVRAQVQGRDEFATMAHELDAMCTRLAGVVGSIRSHAQQVAQTGQQMEQQSHDLASRASQQAATVEESAATLEQVSQTARSNASHVEQVDQLFHQIRHTGADGRQRMQGAVQTVEGIAATSRRVGEIVQVIDGIAFQTNILALNAAVEAARAGESGRGFAVVAGEVRALAQRSASAAGEIRSLITGSAEQVEAGVAEIHKARDSVDRILDQVGGVGEAMGQLATATREQTLAVGQVAEAVRQIGDTTAHNAHSAEATSSAANTLRHGADELHRLVDQLRT